MNSVTFTSICKRLAQTLAKLRSARHSQHGCLGAHGTGAAPQAPRDVAPTPVSTATILPDASPLPDAPARMRAVLATFEGQAAFRFLGNASSRMHAGELFRLRKGYRILGNERLRS
ncbi:hypothetical protein FHS92_000563 [Sphingobium subterraneum]|uniref:Uncharacterized protein n=1 Tax=Sphingobium subterraneum TaxID=627688 RepID=A0A841J003_9SPHN|nr:hypothetical protein [Sphingobium subterraneum]